MKLKNKLIPLASVAAVCTAATTFALTSCGTNTNNDGFVDLHAKYSPKCDCYQPLDGEIAAYNNAKATEIYASNLTDENPLFIDDFLWSATNEIGGESGIASQYDAAKVEYFEAEPFLLTNGESGEAAINVPLFIASFKVSYKYDYDAKKDGPNREGYTEAHKSGYIEAHHLPFWVCFDSSANYWKISASEFRDENSNVLLHAPFITINAVEPKYDIYYDLYMTQKKGYQDWSFGYEETEIAKKGDNVTIEKTGDASFNAQIVKDIINEQIREHPLAEDYIYQKVQYQIADQLSKFDAYSHYLMTVAYDPTYEQE